MHTTPSVIINLPYTDAVKNVLNNISELISQDKSTPDMALIMINLATTILTKDEDMIGRVVTSKIVASLLTVPSDTDYNNIMLAICTGAEVVVRIHYPNCKCIEKSILKNI